MPRATLNDLRGEEWIFPAAKDRDCWHEISEAHYLECLNVMPPIWAPSGFLWCEAASHDARGLAVRAYFVQTASRCFVREVSETKHPEALAELLALLREDPSA